MKIFYDFDPVYPANVAMNTDSGETFFVTESPARLAGITGWYACVPRSFFGTAVNMWLNRIGVERKSATWERVSA